MSIFGLLRLILSGYLYLFLVTISPNFHSYDVVGIVEGSHSV